MEGIQNPAAMADTAKLHRERQVRGLHKSGQEFSITITLGRLDNVSAAHTFSLCFVPRYAHILRAYASASITCLCMFSLDRKFLSVRLVNCFFFRPCMAMAPIGDDVVAVV